MGLLALAQGESRSEVGNEASLLLQRRQKSLVDGLLVLSAVAANLLLLRWG